jgi:hypothetical protein
MAEDSQYFYAEPGANRLPLYEAKLIHHYDHRWATYETDGSNREVTLDEKQDFNFSITPRYWVSDNEVRNRIKTQGWELEWLMGWRDITNVTNERTVIQCVIPVTGCGDTLLLFFPASKYMSLHPCLLAESSCLVHDFVARQKLGGTHLKLHVKKQLPVLPPSAYNATAIAFIKSRALELTYTSHDLKPWAEDLGFDGPPFRFDPERRSLLRAELDAYYAHLYGLNRDELRYILDPADVMGPDYPSETFRVLKNNEIRQFGEYRTQRLVLEAWDRLFGGG